MSGYPLARSEGIVTEELGDELVAYVEATQTAHALSKDAASVWRQCDGHSSAVDIARRLGLDEARVAQALDELSGAELIEEPEGISRRALYKRTAKLGAAALGAPLIYSVAIRPTSAHASTPPCSCPAGSRTADVPAAGASSSATAPAPNRAPPATSARRIALSSPLSQCTATAQLVTRARRHAALTRIAPSGPSATCSAFRRSARRSADDLHRAARAGSRTTTRLSRSPERHDLSRAQGLASSFLLCLPSAA